MPFMRKGSGDQKLHLFRLLLLGLLNLRCFVNSICVSFCAAVQFFCFPQCWIIFYIFCCVHVYPRCSKGILTPVYITPQMYECQIACTARFLWVMMLCGRVTQHVHNEKLKRQILIYESPDLYLTNFSMQQRRPVNIQSWDQGFPKLSTSIPWGQ